VVESNICSPISDKALSETFSCNKQSLVLSRRAYVGRVILTLRDKNIEPPILLPANHRIVSSIIANKHESIIHPCRRKNNTFLTQKEILDHQGTSADKEGGVRM
jgi:hypothetical protein